MLRNDTRAFETTEESDEVVEMSSLSAVFRVEYSLGWLFSIDTAVAASSIDGSPREEIDFLGKGEPLEA